MTPGQISRRVVVDRLATMEELLRDIRALPLGDRTEFFADRRNVWSAESCLRRSLEALLDVGRHILARGFAEGVSEYKQIADGLGEHGVLGEPQVELLRVLAGYRNRLVHFYHEISPEELHEICANHLGDVEEVRTALLRWLRSNPELLDQGL